MIVGREEEIARFRTLLGKGRAQFVALYGRRRVGKTFLIREMLEPVAETFFYVAGRHRGSTATQLMLFQKSFEATFLKNNRVARFRNWDEAFESLTTQLLLRKEVTDKPLVVVLDELPWLATPRSSLVSTIDTYWNTHWQQIPQLVLVVCGSAASWMIRKIVQAKGGLHNRLTARMRIEPFRLPDVRSFLQSRGCKWSDREVVELFMALGGVPYYLDLVKPKMSVAQNIGTLCFSGGELVEEFKTLLASLFRDSSHHGKILSAIAQKHYGLTRGEISTLTKTPLGGRLSTWLEELVEAGFIERFPFFGRREHDAQYRLIDEFTHFYYSWMSRAPKGSLAEDGQKYWMSVQGTPRFASWAGYSFETLCLKHHRAIKSILGFGDVATTAAIWAIAPDKVTGREGAQIDLLFERADKIITLCEIRYAPGPLAVGKSFLDELQQRANIFREATRTKKRIQWAIITPYGVKSDISSQDSIQGVVTGEDLFRAN